MDDSKSSQINDGNTNVIYLANPGHLANGHLAIICMGAHLAKIQNF